jgi:hypothetical protein
MIQFLGFEFSYNALKINVLQNKNPSVQQFPLWDFIGTRIKRIQQI